MTNKKIKRDNGDGSVFFSELKQKWCAKIQYGTDTHGKPLIKYFSSSDIKKGKQIVAKKLKEYKKQMLLGDIYVNDITLNDYIENWLNSYQKLQVKETTFYRDCTVFSGHIKYTIGNKKLSEIKNIDIQRLIDNEKDHYANKTIEKTYSLLNRVYKHAVKMGDINKNPCDGVVLPNVHTNLIKPKDMCEYTTQETELIKVGIYDSFYNHSKLYRASPSYLLLLNTGMRLGELLGLKCEMVDLNNCMLKVVATLETISGNGNKKKILTLPKTKSSYRTIALNKTSLEMLCELKKRNDIQGINSEYVVCNLKGEPFSDNNYRRDFKRFCERYGIEYKGIHTLRHTFASRLFRNGIDVQTVSKLLGHHNPTITQNIYIHILEEQKVKAINLMDSI